MAHHIAAGEGDIYVAAYGSSKPASDDVLPGFAHFLADAGKHEPLIMLNMRSQYGDATLHISAQTAAQLVHALNAAIVESEPLDTLQPVTMLADDDPDWDAPNFGG